MTTKSFGGLLTLLLLTEVVVMVVLYLVMHVWLDWHILIWSAARLLSAVVLPLIWPHPRN